MYNVRTSYAPHIVGHLSAIFRLEPHDSSFVAVPLLFASRKFGGTRPMVTAATLRGRRGFQNRSGNRRVFVSSPPSLASSTTSGNLETYLRFVSQGWKHSDDFWSVQNLKLSRKSPTLRMHG
jgi:hypothetical protein